MELRDALTQIADIRRQMARGQVFRGYRSATTAFSGGVALTAAFIQRALLSVEPGVDAAVSGARDFVALWVIAAAVCLLAVGLEMAWRSVRRASAVQRELTLLAAEQFIPSVAAGGLLTWVFWDFSGEPLDAAGVVDDSFFAGHVCLGRVAAADALLRRWLLPDRRRGDADFYQRACGFWRIAAVLSVGDGRGVWRRTIHDGGHFVWDTGAET